MIYREPTRILQEISYFLRQIVCMIVERIQRQGSGLEVFSWERRPWCSDPGPCPGPRMPTGSGVSLCGLLGSDAGIRQMAVYGQARPTASAFPCLPEPSGPRVSCSTASSHLAPSRAFPGGATCRPPPASQQCQSPPHIHRRARSGSSNTGKSSSPSAACPTPGPHKPPSHPRTLLPCRS